MSTSEEKKSDNPAEKPAKSKKSFLIIAAILLIIAVALFVKFKVLNQNDNGGYVTPGDENVTVIQDIFVNPPTPTYIIYNNDETAEDDYYESEEDGYGGYESDSEYEGEYSDETEGAISISTTTREITDVRLGKPSPVSFYFDGGVEAASIDLIDSEIPKEYIKMEPFKEGVWAWTSAYELLFYPTEDWPADTKYKVTFDKRLFNENVKLKTNYIAFSTEPFTATISDIKIYQPPYLGAGDPAAGGADASQFQDPRVVAAVDFTFPVDPAVFEKSTKVTVGGKSTTFTVKYDAIFRTAYITTAPIRPQKEYVEVIVTIDGATSSTGAKMMERQIASVVMPAMDSYFLVKSSRAIIVNDKEGNPRQMLLVEFSLPVNLNDFKDKFRAYVLPRQPQMYSGDSGFHDWRNTPELISPDELRRGKPLEMNFIKDLSSDQIKAVQFLVSTQDYAYIYIEIGEGLKSANGYQLVNKKTSILRIPKFPETLKFLQDGALLSLSGDKTLTFASRGVTEVRVNVAKVIPSRINHLISQTYGSSIKPEFNYYFTEHDISVVSSEVLSLNSNNLDKLNYFSFNLGKYLKGSDSAGLFIVTLDKKSAGNSYFTEDVDKRLIYVSDMVLLSKTGVNSNKTDVYVMSVADGKPVSGANVYILGRNGISLQTTPTYTDANGHVQLTKSSSNKKESEPMALVAVKGNDFSYIPLNRYDRVVQTSGFDTGGVYSSNYLQGLKAYVFSDRGIYRPEDTVNLGIIVKLESWDALPGVPVEAIITDPKGKTVLNKKFTLNDSGFAELSFKTDYTSPTGRYYVTVNLLNDRNNSQGQLGSADFSVEEFQADKMKITATLDTKSYKGWVPMTDIVGVVKLENLFGKPAQNRRIRWQYQLTPTSFWFKEYKDYAFTNPVMDKKSLVSMSQTSLPDGTTDNDGKATVAIDLSKYSGGTYSLRFLAEGFEDGGGDSVSTFVTKLVSPTNYIVGYKTTANASYIKRNTTQTVNYIAVNPNLEQIDLNELRYDIVEKKYVSMLVKLPDDTYSFQSALRENVVKSGEFAIAKTGTTFNLDTTVPGDFTLMIYDKQGMLVSRFGYYVAGEANLTMSLDKRAELSVALDKKEYSAGDTIELNIIAPYTGSGLITIERDNVYTHKWFTTTTTASKQTIKLPDNIEGNAYVSVSFLRSADSREIFVSPYSYAVVPFNINREKRNINITLSAPEEVKPGDTLKINYKVSANSKIVVFAVNEGILQVAKYQTPNPLGHFFQKRALRVTTLQILDLVLADARVVKGITGIGGDYLNEMENAKMVANLNPFKRKTDAPVAYWSGLMDARVGEVGSVEYEVPAYFNGKLRLMAVAASAGAVGATESSTISIAPIILQPSMPVVAAPTDTFDVSVSVFNNVAGSGKDGLITVEMIPDAHFEAIGDTKKTITLSDGYEGRVDFALKTKDKLGSATVTFKAELKDNPTSKVQVRSTVSVRPATYYSTTLTTRVTNKNVATLENFARDMYPEFADRSATASSSPLLVSRGLSDYLVKYPHGCTEQIISQGYPGLFLSQQPEMTKVSKQDNEEALKNIIVMLRSRQLSNGGFALWYGGRYVNEFATIYAMHYLADAATFGYSVPQDITTEGARWMREFIVKTPSSLDDARLKAYAAYVLTRFGYVTTSFLTTTEEWLEQKYPKVWKEDIISSYMAAIYKMLKNDARASELIRGYKPEVKERFVFFSDFDSSSLRNATYLYLTGGHFHDEVNQIDTKIVMNLIYSVEDMHYSSILSASIINALVTYSQNSQLLDKDIAMYVDTATEQRKALTVDNIPFAVAKYPADTKKLMAEIKEMGKMGFFLVATEQGFDVKLPSKVSQGIEVTKEYLDANGKAITSAIVGDDITVKLKIRTNGNRDTITNVAVIDLLPATLEGRREGVTGSFDYLDVREDRLVFYVTATNSTKELTYKAKVMASGDFAQPAVYAESMYDPVYRGNSAAGRFTVKRP